MSGFRSRCGVHWGVTAEAVRRLDGPDPPQGGEHVCHRPNMQKAFAILGMILFAVSTAGGQTPYLLGGWNTRGTNSTNFPSPWDASSVGSGVTNASLQRGAGLNSSGLTNAFVATGWDGSTSLATALAATNYYQFTLAPVTGNEMSLDRVEFRWRTTGTGPQSWQFAYSLDGFATDTNAIGLATDIIGGGTQVNDYSISLTNILGLQGFTNAVTFRLVGWGQAQAVVRQGSPTTLPLPML